jgi:hypothetical protein
VSTTIRVGIGCVQLFAQRVGIRDVFQLQRTDALGDIPPSKSTRPRICLDDQSADRIHPQFSCVYMRERGRPLISANSSPVAFLPLRRKRQVMRFRSACFADKAWPTGRLSLRRFKLQAAR